MNNYHNCDFAINYKVVYTGNWRLLNVYKSNMPLRDATIRHCPFCGIRLTEKCFDCGFIFDGRSEPNEGCDHDDIEGYELKEELDSYDSEIEPITDICTCPDRMKEEEEE